MKFDKFKYLFILFVAFFFFGGIPVEFGTEGAFFHGFMIPKPVITVGLGTNLKDIHIRSSAGMKIYEVDTGYRLIADDADEIRIKGGGEKLTEKYRHPPGPRQGARRGRPAGGRIQPQGRRQRSQSPRTSKPTRPASTRSGWAIS